MQTDRTDVLIIGGGMAGLSTGCYARMNGFEAHILEHNIELGGMCTAWKRGPYLIDGCIQWLMGAGAGGMFRTIYDELGIIRDVDLQPIDLFHRFEDPTNDRAVELGRDLGRYREDLVRLSPDDAEEIDRLLDAAAKFRELRLPVDQPPELTSIVDRVRTVWGARHLAGSLLHFRGSIGEWCERSLRGQALREYFASTTLADMPMLVLPVLMQHVADGQMSRPRGGSGVFRDAIVRRFRELGGQASLNTTVEEILVEGDRAVGVRLTDGSELRARMIVSTASAHETHLRLLGGRYLDRHTRRRLDDWPTFEPIVLMSAGVEMDLSAVADTLIVKQDTPLVIGERPNDDLQIRIFQGDPSFAPPGHHVVQSTLSTSYNWWAERGADYTSAKERAIEAIIERIDRRLPGLAERVRMTDLSTPLTFWRQARAWRGAYEGWMPTTETIREHVPKISSSLSGLYFAGQWVEPGGGIPPALMSGRQVVQLLCANEDQLFQTEVAR